MKANLFLLLMTTLLAGRLVAQKNGYWQQQVNYDIEATLNDKQHTLDGKASIEYINQSPDSLPFLWVHLWPNAYKNDRTAFAEQQIKGGMTDFYFCKDEDRGYINRLDFKANGTSLLVEDDSLHIDIVKILLPKPLAPGEKITIHSPFHVQIPALFSRMGHKEQHYQMAQWYPKIAVYDSKGWHPMPYLEWGEYYNDFGNYKVRITLPANYAVAATGMLQNKEEKTWLQARTKPVELPKPVSKKKELFPTGKKPSEFPESATSTKTLEYQANNVTDFAWMADKRFIVKYDTAQLASQTVELWNFLLPADLETWRNSMAFTKRAIHFYSEQLGNYAYPQATVMSHPDGAGGGMEYPMLTTLNTKDNNEQLLDVVIAHELGHNWLKAVIASNERTHTWMDEGINSYFEQRYLNRFYPDGYTLPKSIFGKKQPADEFKYLLDYATSQHTDQPIETASANTSSYNYTASNYAKAPQWMQQLEALLGKDSMQQLMHEYYAAWQFKHPYPEDFKALLEEKTGRNLTEHFNLLQKTGLLAPEGKLQTKITGFFNLRNTDKYRYISLAPAIGYNNYDKLELGLLVHNYNIPASKFQFIVSPMLGTGTGQLVGIGRASYNWFPKGKLQKVQLYASASRFHYDDAGILKDLDGNEVKRAFSKLAPGIYFEWKKKNALSTIRKWADFRTFIIGEQKIDYLAFPPPGDTAYYAHKAGTETTVIPQLSLGIANEAALNPWSMELVTQQVKELVKTSFTAKYLLHYNSKGQGLAARLFFGKIFYTQAKTAELQNKMERYHFFMYGYYGGSYNQDYTYSNVFAERSPSDGLLGRQIMIRDGGFKYRTDFGGGNPGTDFKQKQYYFDNWLASLNLTLDVPDKINPLSVLPVKMPLKIFGDFGTSHIPWRTNSDVPKFLYSIGLQLPLFNCINVYYPLIQSKEFKEPTGNNGNGLEAKWWQRRLTFSIDMDVLKAKASKVFVL